MKTIAFVDVGEGITEGHVQKWLVNDGDTVKEDEPVVQVETDKAIVSVPAPISGKIKISIPGNSTVHIGDVLAYIGDEQELKSISSNAFAVQQPAQPKTVQQVPVAEPTPAPPSTPSAQASKAVIATPSVRKMARDNNISLANVSGTGPGGRILEDDLKNYIDKSAAPKTATKFSEVREEKHASEIQRIPMSQTRKTIAKNMELSESIPRAVHMDLIDAGPLYSITSMKKEAAAKAGVKFTFLPLIIKATVSALKENPSLNSSYDPDKQEIILKKYYNIGLAAETKEGLKVVVIKDADKKSAIDIAKEIQSFHKKLIENTITIDEMRDSTFTITNIGSLGGGYLSVPLINPHEAAILGVHLVKDAAVVKDGKIAVGKQLPLSLSFDHRILDGAEAATFVNSIKKYLEDAGFLDQL
ncbi:MAG: 2-oxo acid dehydrogenase subunit E2 [Candidatus Marsarchaeota archaeon]|nr:2-oxo acid dehydrogenase subunit E2 [Candidatus Marsarchaeota archaeon]MCL5413405.1 2-oxo acid dehydrogenase subunit E2 [Candidatus Marsarchaeota archaeon]